MRISGFLPCAKSEKLNATTITAAREINAIEFLTFCLVIYFQTFGVIPLVFSLSHFLKSPGNCLIADCIGHAAASPSGQNDLPSMLSQISSINFASSGRPPPDAMRSNILTSQSVPSRHGVHQPHDSCL